MTENEEIHAGALALKSIKHNEGFRAFPYTDTTGHTTIGYGRNLSDVGILIEEAEILAKNDLDAAELDLRYACPDLLTLDPIRYAVCLEMVYNLGIPGFMSFKKMRAALEFNDFSEAAAQMLDSRWATQVGNRAKRLAAQIDIGVLPA